ncbi:RHS repeat-associated core domain-containing protein [Streptomyces sp. NPDC048282]|uniref:RHS repeat-associated core domain-containing protein n=1 Tax=Streptomyces sp. NPDC048282 TaxID=3365528 RepID=UPI0037100186
MTPFGEDRGTPLNGPWADDKGFLGKTADTDTGLTHIGAREYDANTGQFLSVDPVLQATLPQTLNGYSYGVQNPATNSDPDGLALLCGVPHEPACPDDGDPMPESADNDGNGNTLGQPGKTHKDAGGNYCDSRCVARIYYQQWLNAKRIAAMTVREALIGGYQLPDSSASLGIAKWVLPDCDQACQESLGRLQSKYLIQNMSQGKDEKSAVDKVLSFLDDHIYVQGQVCVVVLCGSATYQNGYAVVGGAINLPHLSPESAAKEDWSAWRMFREGVGWTRKKGLGVNGTVGFNTATPDHQNAGSLGVCAADLYAVCAGGAPASEGDGANGYAGVGFGYGLTFSGGSTKTIDLRDR